ncbi:MAG TPA: 7TM diverse intracellular signaling domain-containing protein [Leptospiraceae bacterium]|nr:7TM diverse intracellular signaling domain-containing protein [Leptospiraceae bacterium]HMX35258.1 7TM diverse intracellular signaling domain-containing protein [Leptospiraceae bacterium]HMY31713.1 7TM diverse intracellular signaling domain-containing protein [Leptospiraceae bacterium]HNA08363.1 7TM diverse intracellular signaling domain-containing protein [Leptospiraceae bacterium]HNB97030.1 7TM diverse intracellular signaling domain-containing protein [Leptospiraceae bacterium]
MLISRMIFFSLLLSFFIPFHLFSDPVQIEGEEETIYISPHLNYFLDKEKKFSFEEISSEGNLTLFQENKNANTGFGYSNFPIWFYFDYETKTSLDLFILEVAYANLDEIEFFFTDSKNQLVRKLLGRLHPFSERDFKHRTYLVSLRDIKPKGRFFIRVKTQSSIQMPVFIHNQKLFFEKDQYNFAFQLVLAGVMFSMFLYNLLLGIALKDKVYFFYLSFTLPASLFLMGYNGITAQFLWGDNPWFNRDFAPVLLALNNLGILLFVRSFLKLKINHPKMDRFIKLLIYISALAFIGSWFVRYDLISRTLVFFVIANSLAAIAAGFLLAKEGYRPAKIYLLAWGILLLGALLLALTGFGIVPINVFTRNLAQFGLGLESILISFALADRIKILEQEKEKAQRESISALKKSERLKVELELARKIQQSIIPRRIPNIPGLEIAAWYRPMETVGGDFYDFRTKESNLGFIMADVSGHGVPAALVVSAVKTAFGFQELNIEYPSDLLKSMNEILRDKTGGEFVTACYAYIDMEKKILITGNAGHSALWIFRKQTGELISLKPKGRALSLTQDSLFDSTEIHLLFGDRILLYTDGLFEAGNHTGELFGEEKIQELLKLSANMSAKEFGESLLKKVIDWSPGEDKLEDDIALIVVDYLLDSSLN